MLALKKIGVAAFALILLLTITACGAPTPTASVTETVASADEITPAEYKDNISGLEEYLKARGYIAGEGAEMGAGQIGATKGFRWTFEAHEGTTVIEIYQYDTKKLNDTAKSIINQVNGNGEFTLYEMDPVKADLLNDGKYLVIYSDTQSDKEHKQKVFDAIDEFKGGK